MVKKMPQRKQDLIKALSEEREAAALVTAGEGALFILTAYKNGETIKELVTLHGQYSPEHGRVFPLYEEEFVPKSVRDQVNAEDESIEEVAYYWELLASGVGTNFAYFAANLSAMENSIRDLISYHPDYDENHGVIR
jgi:hypothetical protein